MENPPWCTGVVAAPRQRYHHTGVVPDLPARRAYWLSTWSAA
ncbi:MAG TPA: hypothetical protein PKK15_15620 [Kouleothrix sp.]|nr:hypothetical protein [Kouleothrix sp.]